MNKIFLSLLVLVSFFMVSCDDSNYDYGALIIRGQSSSMFWKYSYSGSQTIASEEGGYYLGATVSYNDDGSLFSKKAIALVKFSSTRDVIWQKYYPITVDYNRVFIKKENNNVYLCSGNDRDIEIIKHDASGNLIWKKSFGIAGVSRVETLESFIKIEDGFLIGGNSNDTQSSDNNCSFILKVDFNGSLVWSKKYSLSYLSDLGYKNNTIYALSKEAVIMTADATGSVKDSYKLSGLDQYYDYTIITDLEGIIIGGKKDNDLFIARLLDDYTISWQYKIGGQYDEGVKTIIKTSDNSLLITALTISFKGSSSAKNTNNIWLLKCSLQNGALQWQKVYDLNGESPSALLENDKGYMITGSYNNFNGDNRALMLQVDSSGSMPGYKGNIMNTDTSASRVITDVTVNNSVEMYDDIFSIIVSDQNNDGENRKSDIDFM